MNTALSASICANAPGSPAGTNCGRNAKKKIVSLGFSRLSVIPAAMTLRHELGFAPSSSTVSAPLSRQVAQAM